VFVSCVSGYTDFLAKFALFWAVMYVCFVTDLLGYLCMRMLYSFIPIAPR